MTATGRATPDQHGDDETPDQHGDDETPDQHGAPVVLPHLEPPPFTANAREIFDLRYARKGDDGQPDEDPRDTMIRLALNVAAVTPLYERGTVPDGASATAVDPGTVPFPLRSAVRQHNWLLAHRRVEVPFDRLMAGGAQPWEAQARRYQRALTDLIFLPNTPTWTGAGMPIGQLAACFVLPVGDDLGQGRDSIFETLKVAALIQQTGGGNGFSFGRLRPRGARVSRTKGEASGPVSFMEIYDAAFGSIAQGGSRRGANMGVLPIDHPDVEEFISAKTVEGKIANFNISVAITDSFMAAVEADDEVPLVHDGEVFGKVPARRLYDDVIANAWALGDPGNLFIDRANRDNPLPARYRLEATNPCGEQWLGPYENCCLGSVAVSRFADWDDGFDWEGFRQAMVTATEFLDDVVDANAYVREVPELEAAAQGGRRIGLGLMGVADAMVKLGVRYGSPEGLDFCSQLTEFARFHCMLASIERARRRGPFEWIDQSIYDPELHSRLGPGAAFSGTTVGGEPFEATLWAAPTALVEHVADFGRPACDWQAVVAGIARHGIRNCAQFTFAPTGTISNVAGLEGSGCEPLFALSYGRTIMQEGDNLRLLYQSALFAEALTRAGVDEDTRQLIYEAVSDNGGSCQGIEAVPQEIRDVFVTAADVTPEEHVWTQAGLQAWVDNSISKTINLPNDATTDDVSRAYRLAFELGCKGITVYRQGSRQLEVLSTGTATAPGDGAAPGRASWPYITPLSIPPAAQLEGLAAHVFPTPTPFGKMQVTVTEHPDHPGRPFDVRITIGKAGNDLAANAEAIGRLVSLAFRLGASPATVTDQLTGIGGQTVTGLGPHKVTSIADGLGKLLQRRFVEPDADPSPMPSPADDGHTPMAVDATRVCPLCKQTTLVHQSGCTHCEIALGGCGRYSGCD